MNVQSGELKVTYKIVPPSSMVSPPSLSQEVTHRFIIAAPPADLKGETELKSYYASLQASVAEARAKLGEELTAWRDAVGNAEVGKEKIAKAQDDDEGEEEEEEDTGGCL